MNTHQTYHIPANFTDAGRLFGLFGIRNAIEALVLAGPAVFLCLTFLPLSITGKIIAALVTAIPLGGFALIGIQDDPLTIFVMTWWRWRRGRGIITYCGQLEPEASGKRGKRKYKQKWRGVG